MPGFALDCSGATCEALKSVGVLSTFEDFSSRDLREALLVRGHKSTKNISRGAILFFGQSKEYPTHVAIAIDDKRMIEAGGGNSSTLTIEIARARNAFVRVRPIRKDLVDAIRLAA